jgi:hypothetical protein
MTERPHTINGTVTGAGIGLVIGFVINQWRITTCRDEAMLVYHYSCGPFYKPIFISTIICAALGSIIGISRDSRD